MKTSLLLLSVLSLASLPAADLMSPAYMKRWSPEVQAKIDLDIEKNRKADALIKFSAAIPAGTDIKIEQITHDFVFGAHIFNFNQLGTPERNRKYLDLYGPFFNSATIGFYWRDIEPEPGKLRFTAAYEDSEEFWNNCADPDKQPHWRRPAADPVVEFCESRGIRMHGHPLIFGSLRSNWPDWLRVDGRFCPEDERKKLSAFTEKELAKMPLKQIEEMAPVFAANIARLLDKRFSEIAARYGPRIHSWDVANEITTKRYPLPLPADYVFTGFKAAEKYFPKKTLFNINDFATGAQYPKRVRELLQRGAKIDIMGVQMHIFGPANCRSIAAGKFNRAILWPDTFPKLMKVLDEPGVPIHMSEITIPSPGTTPGDLEIQAIIARNLYRLWFSHSSIMGITWWNVVDGCGFRGEPSTSGLFTRDMEPKPAFHALNQLINRDWKTNLTIKNPGTGSAAFRGFKGKYKIAWQDASGHVRSTIFHLKTEGDSVTLE